MKPISQLKSFQPSAEVGVVLKNMERLFSNPKRHVRGPFYSAVPGNGRSAQFPVDHDLGGTMKNAVAACASGALDFLAYDETQTRTRAVLNRAASELFNLPSATHVSETLGRRPLLRVIKLARKYVA